VILAKRDSYLVKGIRDGREKVREIIEGHQTKILKHRDSSRSDITARLGGQREDGREIIK
jgi:hypothetical protein